MITEEDQKLKQPEDAEKMQLNIKEQLAEPTKRKKDHVRMSLIHNTTMDIKRIQLQLVAGYSFDTQKLNDLVKAMFEFINGVVHESDG